MSSIHYKTYSKGNQLMERGMRTIPSGCVSVNRRVEPHISFVRAQGSRLYDIDGNEYIDYHGSFAPMILGHNDPDVNNSVLESLQKGESLMGSGAAIWEVELAEKLCEIVPCLEQVQMTTSGSEATAHAIRLARSYTKRTDIVLMLGGFNGFHNDVARHVMPAIEDIGPRVSPGEYKILPMTQGIIKSTYRHMHVINFNDIDSLDYIMNRFPIACVMTEPVLMNIGMVQPQEGYLKQLREKCDQYGALFILDEVKTGFRLALGGYQSIAGVTADLSTYAKAMANGYPIGVIGGKKEVMELFFTNDTSKSVAIAGTYNAHPFSAAAAKATISQLQKNGGEIYQKIDLLGLRLQRGLEELYKEKGVQAVVSRIGSAFCTYFCDHLPQDWHDILEHHDFEFDKRYRRLLIDHGIYIFPLACKQGSISASHTESDIDKTLEITRQVLHLI